MPTMITARDETASGEITHQIEFLVPAERITIRELIRSRVFQETKDHRARLGGVARTEYSGPVQPTDTELQLNGERAKPTIDWQRQFERAVAAFRRGQILVLVDDRQFQSLDDEINVASNTSITFLRLTPLAGG